MNHKKIALVAVIMCIVFGTIVAVYPTKFHSEEPNKAVSTEPALPPAQPEPIQK